MTTLPTVPFNKPYLTGLELQYIQEAVSLGKISGNGEFTRRCQQFFENRYGFNKCLLTTSCTDALEMAAILLDILPGDEVILPSFTFVSTANAFVLRGAKLVFVDSQPDHPNMDETRIEELITPKTKAILVVHYGGKACEMDTIMDIANRHGIHVVEDAAQAIDSFYKEKPLGGIGHLGCFSFHETKNIQCGEGGMLVINDSAFAARAEIIWEKGTNRAAFFRGEIDKYGWVDFGSSFLPSEVTAAFLWAQLENLDPIQARRKTIWEDYLGVFSNPSYQPKLLNSNYTNTLKNAGSNLKISHNPQPLTSDTCPPWRIGHRSLVVSVVEPSNYHIFYLLFQNVASRTDYASYLREKGILAVFHYQSLHKSTFSQTQFPDQSRRHLPNSDSYSDCLLRLPMFYELPELIKT
jgi:dTDP-4-amino-4,6-dideoxygalactose transaminase